jgi:CelD/BcsL family acetyltransferase involved in cellulose biosynthesis
MDPLNDSRWTEFVNLHPSSSVFHTPEWLRALRQTYGFSPVVLTSSPPGQALANGIPFCRISSVFTGKRLVSLPFSDHCQPLAGSEDLQYFSQVLSEMIDRGKLKYIELRPLAALTPPIPKFVCSEHYKFHLLSLRPSLDEIFRKFHVDCIRRKIRRAEREGLTTEAGRSEKLLDEFYALQIVTRRKHGLPPQPRQWFRNVLDFMGEKAVIRMARHEGRAIASILMLEHKKTAIYKYGCSENSDSNRGGTQLILWQAIEDAKAHGMEVMDLGRGDIEDEGLAIFKERWGAERQELEYFRYPAQHHQVNRKWAVSAEVMARIPNSVLVAAGRLLYRHIA